MEAPTKHRSARQQQTFERLLAATRELAETRGYAKVTMDAIARRAGVSRITAYQYFRNKDHALAEVIVTWAEEVAAGLDTVPQADVEPVRQIQARFEQAIQILYRRPRLLAAVLASAAAPDPQVVALTEQLYRVVQVYIGAAGNRLVERQEDTVRLLGYLFQSILSALATGRITLAQAQVDISQGVAALVRDAMQQTAPEPQGIP